MLVPSISIRNPAFEGIYTKYNINMKFCVFLVTRLYKIKFCRTFNLEKILHWKHLSKFQLRFIDKKLIYREVLIKKKI